MTVSGRTVIKVESHMLNCPRAMGRHSTRTHLPSRELSLCRMKTKACCQQEFLVSLQGNQTGTAPMNCLMSSCMLHASLAMCTRCVHDAPSSWPWCCIIITWFQCILLSNTDTRATLKGPLETHQRCTLSGESCAYI